jgi:hypothetical protein
MNFAREASRRIPHLIAIVAKDKPTNKSATGTGQLRRQQTRSVCVRDPDRNAIELRGRDQGAVEDDTGYDDGRAPSRSCRRLWDARCAAAPGPLSCGPIFAVVTSYLRGHPLASVARLGV